MHTAPILPPQAQALVARIRAELVNVMGIYAFGSRIQGTANADSDLDMAVLVARYADPVQLWSLSSELAALVNCPVDLLDLRAASTVMQYQVLTTGVRLWSVGVAVDLFECYVLSEKTALDTARRPLLEDIAMRGAVYGR